MAKEVIVEADKIKSHKEWIKRLKLFIITMLIILMFLLLILSLVFNGGKFSIVLDKEFATASGIVLYDDSISKNATRILYADDIEYMDNTSGDWIPRNVDTVKEGPHNGDNYIAYTFYLENQGQIDVHYWYAVYIDDVLKGVDDAIRIMIFRNGEKTIYAKINSDTNAPEKGTKEFFSNEIAVLEKVENLKVGDVDKYTVVIWLEGNDKDCVNKIIGGEIKLHMEITEEHY